MQLAIKGYLFVGGKENVIALYAYEIKAGDIGLREGPQAFSHINLAEGDCFLIPWRGSTERMLKKDDRAVEIYLLGTAREPTS